MKSLQQLTPTTGFPQAAWSVFVSVIARRVVRFLVQAKRTSFCTVLRGFTSKVLSLVLIFLVFILSADYGHARAEQTNFHVNGCSPDNRWMKSPQQITPTTDFSRPRGVYYLNVIFGRSLTHSRNIHFSASRL